MNRLSSIFSKTFKEYLKETERSNFIKRSEHNGITLWAKFQEISTNLTSNKEYTLYKYKNYYFLTKDFDYIAHIDYSKGKISDNGKGINSIFIDDAYSSVRGGYDILINLILKSVKLVVSGVQLSEDAEKYYTKVLKNPKVKYILQDNEVIVTKKVKFSSSEINDIFNDNSLTIGQVK